MMKGSAAARWLQPTLFFSIHLLGQLPATVRDAMSCQTASAFGVSGCAAASSAGIRNQAT